MQPEFQTTIRPVWHYVREIRTHVGEALANYPSEVRTAATITAAELLENAIKYGESMTQAPSIQFSLAVNNDELRIETVNGCTNPRGLKELRDRIDELAAARDKVSLYLTRLEELLARPSETGKLGLYRIAFEGEFDVVCTIKDNIVTVTATRKIS